MPFGQNELTKWRSEWPICNETVYVNHAAVCPFSSRVQRAIREWVDRSGRAVVQDYDRFLQEKENTRELAARLMHADPSSIAFVKNTSDGLSLLTSGLDWAPGDRIIVPACEFPSNLFPFLQCRAQGVEVDLVPMRGHSIDIRDFESRITPRTRLISTSFVQFHNGFRHDLQTLGQLCKKHGILFCVDSIQGLGVVPFYAEEWNIDFVANGSHKWLLAPPGLGLIYVSPRLLDQLRVTRLGWLSVKDPWAFDRTTFELLDGPRRFEMGNENVLGMAGLQASLQWLVDIGVERIYDHVVFLLDRLVEHLQTMNVEIITPMDAARRSGIFSFRIPGDTEKIRRLHEHLTSHGVACALRQEAVRISPHFYNTPDEMDRIADTIRRALP
jgi:selenocysteine lyase/cysteine desulfurase